MTYQKLSSVCQSENLSALAARVASWTETSEALEIGVNDSDKSSIKKFVDRVRQLCQLPDNWDSHKAKSVKFESAVNAIRLFCEIMFEQSPMPDVVPTVRGNLQLEWHVHGIDLEVEVLDSGVIVVGLETDDGVEEDWTESFNYAVARLRPSLERLTLKEVSVRHEAVA